MSDFVITINDKQHTVKVIGGDKISINGEEKYVSLTRVNNYAYLLHLGNKVYEITSEDLGDNQRTFLIDGHYFEGVVRTSLEEKANRLMMNKKKDQHHDEVKAPMPGMVLRLKKKEGDEVKMGDSLLVLEAMKMENDLKSPSSGTIKNILINEGDSVEKNKTLLVIE